MTMFLGKRNPGSTVYIPFHAFDSNDPSASTTISGFTTADIEVYKGSSMTQRASDAGYTLLDTDGIDIDATTGINGCYIDLSNNTTAGFWAAGSHYFVVIGPITIDTATINFIPVMFEIGYEGAILDTTMATRASQTSFTLANGPADDDALNNCSVLIHDVASADQRQIAYVADYTGASKTVTLEADPAIFTTAAADNVSFFMPGNIGAINAAVVTGKGITANKWA